MKNIPKNAKKKICPVCHEIFLVEAHDYLKQRCCSPKCAGIYKRTQVMRTCYYCGINFKTFLSGVKRGQGKYCSKECYGNSMRSINPYPRRTQEYKKWRQAVLERENYHCQACDKKANVAHHWKSFSFFPAEAFFVENGATLCEECHIAIHQEAKIGFWEPRLLNKIKKIEYLETEAISRIMRQYEKKCKNDV